MSEPYHTPLNEAQTLNRRSSQSAILEPTRTITKPAVIHETILGQEKDIIQPVIHREREQTEIHQLTQPFYQREVRPIMESNAMLPAEYRPIMDNTPRELPLQPPPMGTVQVAPLQRELMQQQPIVEEVVHRRIIEEITPVIQKEILQPRVVHHVQPIYEKIIEAPMVVQSVRPVQQLGQGFQQAQFTGQGFPAPQPWVGPGAMPNQLPAGGPSPAMSSLPAMTPMPTGVLPTTTQTTSTTSYVHQRP